MNERPIARRQYYSIGEVCDLTGLKPHVLRYWETQFETLRPTKNRAGNRVYRPAEVELVLLVKQLLYDQKYTIEGARQHLKESRREGVLADQRRQATDPEILSNIRDELDQLILILTPDPIGDGDSP